MMEGVVHPNKFSIFFKGGFEMADVKISALPSETDVPLSDVLPMVVGGVTSKVTKNNFLLGAAGENINLTASSGQIAGVSGETGTAGVSVTNDDTVTAFATIEVNISVAGATVDNQILIQDSTGITITVDQGNDFIVQDWLARQIIKIDTTALTCTIGGGYTPLWQYAPTVPTDWLGTPPATVQAALDRLAACFTTNALIKP